MATTPSFVLLCSIFSAQSGPSAHSAGLQTAFIEAWRRSQSVDLGSSGASASCLCSVWVLAVCSQKPWVGLWAVSRVSRVCRVSRMRRGPQDTESQTTFHTIRPPTHWSGRPWWGRWVKRLWPVARIWTEDRTVDRRWHSGTLEHWHCGTLAGRVLPREDDGSPQQLYHLTHTHSHHSRAEPH